MITLNDYIRESLLDDEEDLVNDDKWIIEQTLKENYTITGKYIINNGKIDVQGKVYVKNRDIEDLSCNGIIQFGKVSKSFDCIDCPNLKNFKGAPEEIGWEFWGSRCENIDSLIGITQKIGRSCYIGDCEKLKDLEYGPKYVGGKYICPNNLESLKGIAKYVGDELILKYCKKLKNIDYLPEQVGTILINNRTKVPDKFRNKYDFKQY